MGAVEDAAAQAWTDKKAQDAADQAAAATALAADAKAYLLSVLDPATAVTQVKVYLAERRVTYRETGGTLGFQATKDQDGGWTADCGRIGTDGQVTLICRDFHNLAELGQAIAKGA
jgi:hypothetical protein